MSYRRKSHFRLRGRDLKHMEMAFSFVRTIKLVFIVTLKIRLFNTRLKIMINRDIKKGELIEKTKISWSTMIKSPP